MWEHGSLPKCRDDSPCEGPRNPTSQTLARQQGDGGVGEGHGGGGAEAELAGEAEGRGVFGVDDADALFEPLPVEPAQGAGQGLGGITLAAGPRSEDPAGFGDAVDRWLGV